MPSKLTFEFPSKNLRRAFLACFCDDGIERSMGEQLLVGFDFSQASWIEPTVRVFKRRKLQ
jgi:hypothetical protein